MRKSMLVLAAFVIVFACKKNETAPAETSTQSTSTTATTVTTAAPPPAQPTQTTASAAPTAGAIAGADGETPGMHVEITELKRASGGTVNLKYVLTNGGAKTFSVYSMLGDAYDGNGVNLVDPVNKKKYFVITDSEKNCQCSRHIAGSLGAGEKFNLWAKFPAPPPDVTKVSIEIPHFQPIDDVPISQ